MDNRNQNPQPFQVILPWGNNPIVPQQPMSCPENEVPARIRVAMDFLVNLTVKTMARGMVNDIAFETLPGQTLKKEELLAQANACHLLSDYFTGKLSMDPWEKQRSDAFTKLQEAANRPPGFATYCPDCNGVKGRNCKLCRGTGSVQVSPNE
jgi:hypothetical protein